MILLQGDHGSSSPAFDTAATAEAIPVEAAARAARCVRRVLPAGARGGRVRRYRDRRQRARRRACAAISARTCPREPDDHWLSIEHSPFDFVRVDPAWLAQAVHRERAPSHALRRVSLGAGGAGGAAPKWRMSRLRFAEGSTSRVRAHPRCSGSRGARRPRNRASGGLKPLRDPPAEAACSEREGVPSPGRRPRTSTAAYRPTTRRARSVRSILSDPLTRQRQCVGGSSEPWCRAWSRGMWPEARPPAAGDARGRGVTSGGHRADRRARRRLDGRAGHRDGGRRPRRALHRGPDAGVRPRGRGRQRLFPSGCPLPPRSAPMGCAGSP